MAGQATIREMLTERNLIDMEPSTQQHAVHYVTIYNPVHSNMQYTTWRYKAQYTATCRTLHDDI